MKTKKINLEKRNAEVFNFNAFLESQKAKVAKVKKEVEANKTVREATENFSISSSVLVNILNAGSEGITVGEIMLLPPICNEKSQYSIDSIGRDFNTTKNYPMQTRQVVLNSKGYLVGFTITQTPKAKNLSCKANNHIVLVAETKPELLRFLRNETNWNESFLTE